MNGTTSVASITLEADDITTAERFYATAFGLGPQLRLRAGATSLKPVAKSFGGKYAEFTADEPGRFKPALYKRAAPAKDVGVADDGTGSHRIALAGSTTVFTDPDGFAWEAPSLTPAQH
ncbi:hypothetical protein ACICHK_37695 [Streptomyces sp. AHU1]|uniref:hypothetical protein n=1 Tax=Streptomyces sp. AHU1 TaxID=3377215 RepID=UPI003877A139